MFLSSLMGMLMFLILHRIAVFFYLLFATFGDGGFAYYSFIFWDYITLSTFLVIGAIYGFWVGKYWYKSVYHESSHGGLVSYVNSLIWDEKPVKVAEVYKHKLEAATQKIEEDLTDLENLEKNFPVVLKPKPLKRTLVIAKKPAKKRAVKTKTKAKA